MLESWLLIAVIYGHGPANVELNVFQSKNHCEQSKQYMINEFKDYPYRTSIFCRKLTGTLKEKTIKFLND
jgi:hypothetical protein